MEQALRGCRFRTPGLQLLKVVDCADLCYSESDVYFTRHQFCELSTKALAPFRFLNALQRFMLSCGREERFSDLYAGFRRAPTVHIFSQVALRSTGHMTVHIL